MRSLRADLSAERQRRTLHRQFGEQPIAKGEHSLRAPRPINSGGGFQIVGFGPDREAALISRLMQRQVLGCVRWPEHLHLVQVQELIARQLYPHKAGRLIGKLDAQRLVVAEAIERAAVMAIDGRPTMAIIGQA